MAERPCEDMAKMAIFKPRERPQKKVTLLTT